MSREYGDTATIWRRRVGAAGTWRHHWRVATAPDAAAGEVAQPGRDVMRYGCECALVIVTALVVTVVLVIMQWVGGGQQPGQAETTVPIPRSPPALTDPVTIP